MSTTSAPGPAHPRHAEPSVIEAVIKAARNGTSFGASTPAEADLAELVISAFPHMQKFASSVLARKRPCRQFVWRAAYKAQIHRQVRRLLSGHSTPSWSKPGRRGHARHSRSAGVPEEFTQFTLALPTTTRARSSRRSTVQTPDRLRDRRAGRRQHGCVPPASGYLEALRAITKRDQSLLVSTKS